MPIWNFKCCKCNKTKEVFVLGKYFDIQWAMCDDCKQEMTRQPTSASFILKGGGFHRNDYK